MGPQPPPDWAAQQNEKEVLLKTKELGVNMLQFVQSPTHLSHITLSQPFRIKCERYIFSKELCPFVIIVLAMFPHVYVYSCICIMAMQQVYTGGGIGLMLNTQHYNVRIRGKV